MKDLTDLLAAARDGDKNAAGAAFALVYDELHRLAHAKLRDHRTMTLLGTTSLVHESYLRLVASGRMQVADRRHFFAYAARVMRSVIVDSARRSLAQRHGGRHIEVTLDTAFADRAQASDDDLVQINDALDALAAVNPRLVSVVEMRYFSGFSEREIAESLGVSERTVKRDWEKARLLLRAFLR
ncbi:MAG TPA: ECF-type sigma factor [Casimicrobiaceae bacterium]|nr:ECF-type sigma factor [Casimicrobiaceae bacterium]